VLHQQLKGHNDDDDDDNNNSLFYRANSTGKGDNYRAAWQ
jgi:hypothetical protein